MKVRSLIKELEDIIEEAEDDDLEVVIPHNNKELYINSVDLNDDETAIELAITENSGL